ncbi:MAG: hypothetical protein ACLGG7_14250, partial [Bacteriovoracia bacterium]
VKPDHHHVRHVNPEPLTTGPLGSFMMATGASLPETGCALALQSHAATTAYTRLSLDPLREGKARALEPMQQLKREN